MEHHQKYQLMHCAEKQQQPRNSHAPVGWIHRIKKKIRVFDTEIIWTHNIPLKQGSQTQMSLRAILWRNVPLRPAQKPNLVFTSHIFVKLRSIATYFRISPHFECQLGGHMRPEKYLYETPALYPAFASSVNKQMSLSIENNRKWDTSVFQKRKRRREPMTTFHAWIHVHLCL